MRAHRQPRQGRGRALHQIAHAAHIQDHAHPRRCESTMPVSLPIIDAAIDARARARQMRMGDGRGQRIGGIGLGRRRRPAAAA